MLGTLEVRASGELLALGQPKQRAVLALLLVNANRVVPQERLIDELWGADPPVTAVKALRVYVSRLRKLLPAEMLVTRPPGYVLEVEPEALDVRRFERLVADARGKDPAPAAVLLRDALGLWRGPPLAEFHGERFARVEAARLEDMRLAALEERIDADLTLGRHAELVGELEALVAEHPHREHPRRQLMLALYRTGRQADSLEAYREARAALDGLGIEPGKTLRELERRILTQDRSLDLPRERPLVSEPIPLPGALVPTSPFPFVGRARELAALRALRARAEAGEGGLALVAGGAGSGKTRLVRELAHEAAADGVLVLYGVSDATVATPYQPLREWLAFALRVCDDEVLRDALGTGAALARLVPELARLTGPVPPEQHELTADRHLLQIAATELLVRMSRVQPLLLVADDLHWADGETLHLLRRLARTAPEARLLVLGAFRDRAETGDELAETLAELARLDGVERLTLGSLDDEEIAAFVGAATAAEADAELCSAIGELTGGTPLLLCELWRELSAIGALELSDRGVRLSRPLTELRGADRLHDLVRQRLSRLAPETAALVELAAVAGPRVELRVLGEAAGVDTGVLVERVGSAAAIGVIEERPEPAGVWHFTHELVRRAVYDRIPSARRTELHRCVGEALERTHRADPSRVLPELAYHFTIAAPLAGPERGVDYNLRAASAAITAAAYGEAAARLSSALELGIADPQERTRLQVELAYVLREAGQVTEAERTLAASLRAETGPEERRHAAHALVHHLHHELWDASVDPAHVHTLAEDALRTFAEFGDSRGLAEAGRSLAGCLRREGRAAEGRAALETALVHAAASGDDLTRRAVTLSVAFALCDGPTPVADALRRCEELMQSSRGDAVLEASIGRFQSALLAMAGRFDEAAELVTRTGLVLDGLATLNTSFVNRRVAAEAKELLADRAGAQRDLEAAWRWFRDLRHPAVDTRGMYCAYHLGLLYCDDEAWDDAERLLAYGQSAAEAVPGAKGDERVMRLALRARLEAHGGEPEEAVTLAEQAVERAAATDLLNLRARLWTVLADVRRASGATAEAGAALAEAIRLYEAKGNVAAAASLRAAAAT